MHPAFLFSIALFCWLIGVVYSDLSLRKVWNVWVLVGFFVGLGALLIGPQPFWVDWTSALFGCVVVLLFLLPFYAVGWVAAGDVKFALVVAVWFGFSPYLLLVWMGGSLLAGVHAMCIVACRFLKRNARIQLILAMAGVGFDISEARSEVDEIVGLRRRVKRVIPYAGYLALAALYIVWTEGPQMA